MLILSRNGGESIIIGDNVSITIVALSRNQVKLGIIAPKEIPVHREEIYQRIQNEKIQYQNGHDKNIDNLTLPIIIKKRKR